MTRSISSKNTGGNPATGFSLIEVLITLSVSLLALSALVKFQGELFRGDALARARSQAAFLAEQRLETLYAAIPAAGAEAILDGTDTWSVDLAPAADAAVYTRSWFVAADAAAATTAIEVIVAWNDQANRSNEIRLTSLVDPVLISYGAAGLAEPDFVRLE